MESILCKNAQCVGKSQSPDYLRMPLERNAVWRENEPNNFGNSITNIQSMRNSPSLKDKKPTFF